MAIRKIKGISDVQISLSLFCAHRHDCVRARRWREPNKINIHWELTPKLCHYSLSLFLFAVYVSFIICILIYLFERSRFCVIAKRSHTCSAKDYQCVTCSKSCQGDYLSQSAQSYIMKDAKLLQHFDNK